MLYGLDEIDEEFALIAKENVRKLNMKKVIITIIIVVVLIALIAFGIFKLVSSKKELKQVGTISDNIVDNTQIQVTVFSIDNVPVENEEDNEDEDIVYLDKTSDENVALENDINEETSEETQEIQEENTLKVYSGTHKQIANHIISFEEPKKLPVANENAYDDIKAIYTSDEKQVFLTFDDGPTKAITPLILDILKEYDVPATFFVLGSRVESNPDLVKREYEEGHYIANHGYTHTYSKIYRSKDTVFEEFANTETAIKNALDNQDYNSYLFRFPGGSSGGYYEKVKSEARELFKEYGIAYTNWNCLTGDAEGKTTKEDCFNNLIETQGDQQSLIILMHDAADKTQTVEVLPEIIEHYKNEGYTFKNFYDVFSEKEEQ